MKKNRFSLILALFLTAVCVRTAAAQAADERQDITYGDKLFSEGLYDLALLQYEAFLETYPNSPRAPRALERKAACFMHTGSYAQARKEYYNLTVRFPDSPYAEISSLRIAACFEREGKIRQAADAYYRFYTYYPEAEQAFESLFLAAVLYKDLELTGKSEAYLLALINAAGRGEYSSRAKFVLMEIYAEQHRFEETEALARGLIDAPAGAQDALRARLFLGDVYRRLGRWEDAASVYQHAAASGQDAEKEYQLTALRHLAEVHTVLGRADSAHAVLNRLMQSGDKQSSAYAAMKQGELFSGSEDYHDALEAYEKAAELSRDSLTVVRAMTYAAVSAFRLGNMDQALVSLQPLLRSTAFLPPRKALLHGIQICSAAGSYGPALTLAGRFLKAYPSDGLAPFVMIKKAELLLASGGILETAAVPLRDVMERYPESQAAPQAAYVYAQALSGAGRYNDALGMLKSITGRYPWSVQARQAQELLPETAAKTVENRLDAIMNMSRLIQHYASGTGKSGLLYDMGRLSMTQLASYPESIDFYRQYLLQGDDPQKLEHAWYEIAAAWENLYVTEKSISFRDSACTAYRDYLSLYPDGQYAAGASLNSVRLKKNSDLAAVRDVYLRYQKSGIGPEAAFLLGKAYQKADSLSEAAVCYRSVYEAAGPDAEEALCRHSTILYRSGELAKADSLAGVLARQFSRSPCLPEIYLERALSVRGADPATSARILAASLAAFPLSSAEDTTAAVLAGLYLETGQSEKAAELCREYLLRDSLRTAAAETGLTEEQRSLRPEFLRYLSESQMQLRQYRKAANTSLRLLAAAASEEERARVYLRLADTARLTGKPERAEAYLALIPQQALSDSIASRLGEIRLGLGMPAEAEAAFADAERLAESASFKAYNLAGIITSLYRQKKFSSGDARFSSLQKTYKDQTVFSELSASVLLEKAKAYAEQKRFDKAVSLLKDVLKSDTPSRPEAELELGKCYLKMNNIEEALPLLTAMPAKYPESPVLAEVYINLGDHYHNSKQYSNASFTYRRAAEIPAEKEITRAALSRLMNSQAGQGQYDGAMATARRYIELFPDADDVFGYREKIGDFYSELHDYKRAIEIYRALKPLAGPQEETGIQYKLGQCYDNMGLFREAVFEYLKVAYLSRPTNNLPWKATALYNAGQAYQKLDEPAKARRMYEMILEREGAGSHFGKFAREKISEIDAEATNGRSSVNE